MGFARTASNDQRCWTHFALSGRAWTCQVKGTESDSYRVIGVAEQIRAYAEDIGQRRMQGIGVAQLLNERRAKPKPV